MSDIALGKFELNVLHIDDGLKPLRDEAEATQAPLINFDAAEVEGAIQILRSPRLARLPTNERWLPDEDTPLTEAMRFAELWRSIVWMVRSDREEKLQPKVTAFDNNSKEVAVLRKRTPAAMLQQGLSTRCRPSLIASGAGSPRTGGMHRCLTGSPKDMPPDCTSLSARRYLPHT